MHLDKDDLGQRNDMTMVNGEVRQVLINREVVAIRGIIGGWHTVNAHYYSDYANKGKDVSSKLSLYKVNPYSKVYESEKILKKRGSEVTFLRFKLDPQGNVVEKDLKYSVEMVKYQSIHSTPEHLSQ